MPVAKTLIVELPRKQDPFERGDRPKTTTPQDWFKNSEGWFSGQTGQFIEDKGEGTFLPVERSILDPLKD